MTMRGDSSSAAGALQALIEKSFLGLGGGVPRQ